MARLFFRRVLRWLGSLREVRARLPMPGKGGSWAILRPVGLVGLQPIQ